ncbi:hypothetical protein [Streptomyces sp. TLI_171]|uniref:hypothetical protein n=1 Tax=Streptomyces sp. TLI_171 TaxID=1938859 RepID=UPI00117EF295|nr:hypothetical protein [Streptomyces sp. TLI_171]
MLAELRVRVVRWLEDEPQPGIVEARFTDAEGREWSLVDKTAMFDDGAVLHPGASYPVERSTACTVTGEGEDDTVNVTLTWCETAVGRREFTVRRALLVD